MPLEVDTSVPSSPVAKYRFKNDDFCGPKVFEKSESKSLKVKSHLLLVIINKNLITLVGLELVNTVLQFEWMAI